MDKTRLTHWEEEQIPAIIRQGPSGLAFFDRRRLEQRAALHSWIGLVEVV